MVNAPAWLKFLPREGLATLGLATLGLATLVANRVHATGNDPEAARARRRNAAGNEVSANMRHRERQRGSNAYRKGFASD
jgi:hypothetical protein